MERKLTNYLPIHCQHSLHPSLKSLYFKIRMKETSMLCVYENNIAQNSEKTNGYTYVLLVMSLKNCFSYRNLLVGMGESILELSLSNRKEWRSMDKGLLCSNPITPLSGPLPGPHPCTLVSDSLDSKWLPHIMPRL